MEVKKAQRVSGSFLQPLERPTIAWLVPRVPSWMTSDMLTWIGVFGTAVIFLGYLLSAEHRGFLFLASLGFVINWFGDSLDGSLARFRRQERPRYGFLIDHGVDCFSQPVIILGFGLTPFIHLQIAAFAAIVYLMVSIFSFIRALASGTLHLSYSGLGPTEARVVAIALNTVMFFTEPKALFTLGIPLTAYDLVLIVLAIGLVISLLITFVTDLRRLAIEDPLHKPPQQAPGDLPRNP